MKKMLFFGIITFCMLALPAKGQLSSGIKTDINLSNFWVNEATHFKSNMKAGGSAGFFYQYKWRENKAIEADLMFRYRSSEMINQTTGETADYRYFGIELPLYTMIHVEIENRSLYLGIGPFTSFGLCSRYYTDTSHINPYEKEKVIMRRWDFGVGIIIGYEMKCNLQINFNYQFGFRNLIDEGFENAEMISQIVSLGVGYRF